MKMSIGKAASLAGVSVRTLHYYDEIGLLKPDEVTQTGYRLYGENSIARLQQIVFLRELGFPLKSIIGILNAPDYDAKDILKNHYELLILKKKELEENIKIVEEIMKGKSMNNYTEHESEYEKKKKEYAEEAKKRWGNTKEYKESQNKHKNFSSQKEEEIQKEADDIFDRFYSLKDKGAEDDEVQKLVHEWQEHISKYHYECSKEILSCLAEMYIGDERFKNNLDEHGEGTAEFMYKAIKAYVKK